MRQAPPREFRSKEVPSCVWRLACRMRVGGLAFVCAVPLLAGVGQLGRLFGRGVRERVLLLELERRGERVLEPAAVPIEPASG